MDIHIRSERPEDYQAIHDVTQRAFAPMPHADGDEHQIIGRLRDAGVLAVSLVAEQAARVIGQVTLTPAAPVDGAPGWYALGPIAVEPDFKHQGIGSALISSAIDWMKEQDAAGCILVGNPAYYRRFGFRPFPQFAPAGQPAQFFQVLPLRAAEPSCTISFHPLFSD